MFLKLKPVKEVDEVSGEATRHLGSIYQPLYGKGARAPPTSTGLESASLHDFPIENNRSGHFQLIPVRYVEHHRIQRRKSVSEVYYLLV